MVNHQLFELIKQISAQVLGTQAEFSLSKHDPDNLSQADLLSLLMREMASVLARTTDEQTRRKLSQDLSDLLRNADTSVLEMRGKEQFPRKYYAFDDLATKIKHEFFGKGLMALVEIYKGTALVPCSEVKDLVSGCLRNHDLLSDLENQQSLALLLDTDPRLSSVLAHRLIAKMDAMGYTVIGVFHSFKAGADRYSSFIQALAEAQNKLTEARIQGVFVIPAE